MANLYLLAYNTTLFVLWAYCLFLTGKTVLKDNGGIEDVWKAVEMPLKVAQTAALLEVVHSAIGVVRSPVLITGMQVASRLWVLWGIIVPCQAATTTTGLTLASVGGVTLQLSVITLMTAWCITEVIRYGFFACKELGATPYPLLWLRYSAFLPLYPLGVASELTMAYLALPTIRASKLWSLDMPNALNFAFSYHVACLVVIATYLPGLPQLYSYMLVQRKKVLGKGTTATATATASTSKASKSA